MVTYISSFLQPLTKGLQDTETLLQSERLDLLSEELGQVVSQLVYLLQVFL